MGHKSNDKCFYKRHTEERHIEKRKRPFNDGDRDCSDNGHESRNTLTHQKLEEAKNRLSPITFRGRADLQTL